MAESMYAERPVTASIHRRGLGQEGVKPTALSMRGRYHYDTPFLGYSSSPRGVRTWVTNRGSAA
jgi:hypothetical protein